MRYSSSEKDEAVNNTGLNRLQVKHRPRLLSDNSPCYLSGERNRQYIDINPKFIHIFTVRTLGIKSQ